MSAADGGAAFPLFAALALLTAAATGCGESPAAAVRDRQGTAPSATPSTAPAATTAPKPPRPEDSAILALRR